MCTPSEKKLEVNYHQVDRKRLLPNYNNLPLWGSLEAASCWSLSWVSGEISHSRVPISLWPCSGVSPLQLTLLNSQSWHSSSPSMLGSRMVTAWGTACNGCSLQETWLNLSWVSITLSRHVFPSLDISTEESGSCSSCWDSWNIIWADVLNTNYYMDH